MDALIISEGLVGLQAQALGLAERAGLQTELRLVQPRRPWSRFWPQRLRDVPPRVVGCGGAAATVGAGLRRRGHRVVQVQHPRMDPRRFDLVVVNAHDDLTGPNVIVTRTALHRVTPARLAAARLQWEPAFALLPRPLVGVLVGGSNGRFRLDVPVGQALASQLAQMMRLDRVGLALTPSRRTEPGVVTLLRGALEPLGGLVWDGTGENPYFGILALADLLIVTGDSVSMISEAVATDAPVMVAGLPGRSRRIARFNAGLLAEGRIRPYAGRCESWAVAPLDDTDMAAAALQTRLGW